MKKTKITAFALIMILVLSLSACSGSEEPAEESSEANTTTTEESIDGNPGDSNTLIAYFTQPGNDDVDADTGASRQVVDGNVVGTTEFVAQTIQEVNGGELFRIETEEEFPENFDTLVDRAEEDKANNARPALSSQVENLDSYDVIYIGYPNWWADMPMALYTFLEENDLSGKTIIPFATHGGSGFSNTIDSITELQPDATVITDGYSVSRQNVADSEDEVKAWVEEVENML